MKSTIKVFRTLESLCMESPGGVTELSRRLDINKSSMHRFLSVLIQLGYVRREERTGQYTPTLKVYELGVTIKNRMGLPSIAHPYMAQLSEIFRETINLGMFSSNGVVVIERVRTEQAVHADLVIRDPMPAYCSGLGKVFLAHISPEEFERYCQETVLKPLTNRTISSILDLEKAVKEVQVQGYAVDDRELHDGIRCVAAPIFDESGKAIAAISASGSSSVLTASRVRELSSDLVRICMEISRENGYRK